MRKQKNELTAISHPSILLLWWLIYFALYYLTENLIPAEKCHVILCTLDERIPFCEWFAIFYVGWYGLIAFSLLYFFCFHPRSFCCLQVYIMIVQLIATAVYILYPSRQVLRPEVFPRENILTLLIGYIYRIDTPAGVFPSLHAAISIAMASVWLREKTIAPWVRLSIAAFCFWVCLSVCFVKQHSVLDVLGAIPVCAVAEYVLFCRKGR